jgi:adenosylcobinamide kinase/adenosylcobinamide-phosphate guanylyltransferase
MHRKIERHRQDRPNHWTTIEEPLALASVIQANQQQADAILIDCLTLFASNLLEAHDSNPAQLEACISDLCSVLASATCNIILVSNEVGSGVVPAYALGRRFRDLTGEINQRVAAVAGTVVLMVAGLPLPLKGGPRP